MQLYIDPGTGSMLFTILVGILGAAIYALRGFLMKLRFMLTGGGKEKANEKNLAYAIFTDDKRYWNVFCPICEEFERRKQPITYMTASADDPALQRDFQYVKCEFIGAGNKAFAKLNMLNADIVLSSTPGLDVYQWKRSKGVKYYVHILHAVNDTVYRMFGLDYFDAVLLSGDYQADQIREIEGLRGLPAKDLPVVGQPYMDVLYERVKNAPALCEHPVTVLLAPSWGASSILNRYGKRAIDALLATGYHIIVRPHPQSFVSEKKLLDDLMQAYPNSEQLEWNRDNDNFDVLRRADIMISDFSGVIFDFALAFDKPIIYADTDYDSAPYDSCWLKGELWMFSVLPRIGTKLTEENLPKVKEVIDTCLSDERFQRERDKARQEAWTHIGESASLTVDYLMQKHEELTKKADA